MVTQNYVNELMRDCEDNPEIAEAAYLAAQYLTTEQIDRNLRLRYGSGQGFAKFKSEFVEATEFESVVAENNKYGAQIELEAEGESTRLDNVSTEDVDIDLHSVIKNSFSQSVGIQLQESLRESLPSLSYEARALAFILIRGHDLGIWDNRTEPNNSNLWKCYSVLTGETPKDSLKTDIGEELVGAGCIYLDSKQIMLTPAFTRIDDPYQYLPTLEI